MKIKQNFLKIGLMLTALTLLPVAYPAMAEDQVPFKGALEGVDTGIPQVPPFASVTVEAAGNATQLGNFTYLGQFTVNTTTGRSATRFRCRPIIEGRRVAASSDGSLS
jgi:hypothetical protein